MPSLTDTQMKSWFEERNKHYPKQHRSKNVLDALYGIVSPKGTISAKKYDKFNLTTAQ